MDALRARLAGYEKAEADRKAADEKRAEDDLEKARKAGDHEKVQAAQAEELTSLRARVAELEPDAKHGRESREAQKARIEAAKKDLPEADQKLLDAVLVAGGLTIAEDMLARLRAPKAGGKPSPGGTPPPADAPDFDRLAMENPQGFQAAVKKYPAEWSAHKEKLRGPQTRQPTLQERLAMKADQNKPAAKAG